MGVPVHDHARTVGEVVRGAKEHASTVLVCDDGSTDGSGEAARAAGGEVLTLPVNRGKGAALQRLMDEAVARGFKAIICLDADGQHHPSDLPAMAAEVANSPGALVCGARDLAKAGAPKSSRFGRRFSNFWVWFESGARVDDSQCGFRAYPLSEAARVGVRRRRYDAEVEWLIRLAWAGVPLRSMPVQVDYPKERVTHFRPFWDNARISVLNLFTCIRLLLPLPLGRAFRDVPREPGLSLFAIRRWFWLGRTGPLPRLGAALTGLLSLVVSDVPWMPVALLAASALLGWGAFPALITAALALGLRGWPVVLPLLAGAVVFGFVERMGQPRPAKTWTGRSRGGAIGHWFFYAVIRVFGRPFAYVWLYPVALYFALVMRSARRASDLFLERALGPARGWTALRRGYGHFLCFAQTLVDRSVAGIRGSRDFTWSSTGLEHLRQAATSGKGAILLTAHLGNWELAGALLHEEVAGDIAIVAYQGEERALRAVIDRMKGRQPRLIALGNDSLASLEIVRSLRAGALVAMQGDRAMGGPVVPVPFLGTPAPWPPGPFLMAALSGAPLISTFCFKVGPAAYELMADPPRTYRFASERPREEQLAEWMAPYIARVEALARKYPYQWFNFYDFWGTS